MLVKLAIDYENPARRWWDGGGRALWETLLEEFDTGNVVVDESIAHSWLARAAEVPGWNDGPEYAPHPVLLKALDEDEEV